MLDLLYTQGQDNLSGLADVLYIVEQEAIDTASLPTLSAAGALNITGNIVLLATKRFGRLYFTQETGDNVGKSIGGVDGRGVEFMIKGRYPRVDRGFWEWFRTIQNGPLLLIYQQANTGRRYVMGLQNFDRTNTALALGLPVYMESLESTTGAARADESGGTITFKWTSNHGPIEYSGTLDITP